MTKENKIRVMVGAIILNNDKILVCPGYDNVNGSDFFRIIGGGLEFGETLETAIRRESIEETGSDLKNIKYLGVEENIFNFLGNDGHEVFFLYSADLVDQSVYKKDNFKILDQPDHLLTWVDKSILKQSNFYPEGIKKYI